VGKLPTAGKSRHLQHVTLVLVDPTNAALIGGLAGVLLGSMSVFSVRVSERSQRRMAHPPAAPAIPDGASAVLAVLGSSALVLDRGERVVNNSPEAAALGLIRGDRLIEPTLLTLVRQVLRDGEIREVEVEIPATAHRAPNWLHVRMAPLLDAHVLVLVDDRTSAHRVEEVRRDFVVNVSHELKTPVGGLSLLAEAIADARDDPEAVERFASRIQLESARLGKLIKEIVDLSRLQSADGLTEARRVRIADVVREAIEISQVEAQAKDIRIVERVDPATVVDGDLSLLVTAVRNLIGNAISYSPAGTEVGIGAAIGADAVTITVTDHGRGIPPAEQERIFERFYRGDAARSRATGGTGLGLAIVKHICANHGGGVSVWSREGQGSTFTIRLPLPEARITISHPVEGNAA